MSKNTTLDVPVNSLDNIGFVCIEAKYQDKWVLCFHRRRQSWECPGGHVEAGETALEAAKRELFEETGALDYDLVPVWDYIAFNNQGVAHNNGRVYFAVIHSFGPLPNSSEMQKIVFFDELPDSTTYDREGMEDMLKRAEQAYLELKEKNK